MYINNATIIDRYIIYAKGVFQIGRFTLILIFVSLVNSPCPSLALTFRVYFPDFNDLKSRLLLESIYISSPYQFPQAYIHKLYYLNFHN